jgi:hypothetical protein
MHKISTLATAAALTLLLSACASTGRSAPEAAPAAAAAAPARATPAATAKSDTRIVKSRDGSYTGEISGTAAANSKFAKLQIGMGMNEIQDVMGHAPDRLHSYESGKRWIPFYYGNDARRMQVLYKGEGCLIFTGGNIWGGGAGDLLSIAVDPTGACYQP